MLYSSRLMPSLSPSLRHVPLDEMHTNAGPCVDGILVFRPVASLFFGNAHSLRTEFFKVIKAADNPAVRQPSLAPSLPPTLYQLISISLTPSSFPPSLPPSLPSP